MTNKKNILILVLPTAAAIVVGLFLSIVSGMPDEDAWMIGFCSFFPLVTATALAVRYRQLHSSEPDQTDHTADSENGTAGETYSEGEDTPSSEQEREEPAVSISTKIFLLIGGAVILAVYGLMATGEQGSATTVFLSTASAGVLVFVATLLWQNGRCESRVSTLTEEYEEEVAHWRSARIEVVEDAWFEKQIESLSINKIRDEAPEVEVEVKLIYPLLRHLGYERYQLQLRVPVSMQEGSQRTVRQADWVVRGKNNGECLVVVEAKAPRKPLDDSVAKQARSYALRLEAPVYATTNGKRLRVYHRGVLKDKCVLSCSRSELHQNWEAIDEALGKDSVTTLKYQLA